MSKAKSEPILRLPWQRGEDLLAQGYIVLPMRRAWCYKVVRPTPTNNPDGPTTSYHVCINTSDSAFGCDCPDHARHGDIRPCKHILGVYVQLWRWAAESPLRPIANFMPILEELGIPEMRNAAIRFHRAPTASVSVASFPAVVSVSPAPSVPAVSHSGRPLQKRDPSQHPSRPWPKNSQREGVLS